jgi:uncharacterized protein YgiM (DUF1202 family)
MMNKLILITLITLLTAAVYAQTLPGRIYVAADALNVREAPDNTSGIKASILRDTVLKPLQIQNGWYEVEVARPDKLVGWVNSEFTSAAPTRASSEITRPVRAVPPPPSIAPVETPLVRSNPVTVTTSTAKKDVIQNIKVVEGEGLHYVKVSMRDISRVSCPTEIGLPFYSKEKEIEVQKHDKELFIKILPRQVVYSDGRTEINYSDITREMYIKCGSEFFSLVLIPENIPAQHIVLSVPTANIKESIKTETASEYEKTIVELIKTAYLGVPPTGYKVIKERNVLSFKEAELSLNVRYLGYYYIVEEWTLKSTLKEEREFDETAFIPIFKDVKAVTMINPLLLPQETTRMIVVMSNNPPAEDK